MTVWQCRFAVLAAAMAAATVLVAGDDVLYWMVDANATITTDAESSPPTTTTINSFFDNIGDYFPDLNTGEGSAFAARIRVTGGDITEDTFLDLYLPGYGVDEGGGAWGVEFSEVGGYWGAGVPTGNQSPSGDYYSAGTPEYSFIVELGNIDAQDNWTTVAQSAAATYSSLADYIHQTFDINPGQIAVWTPTEFTVVPEPSSGLMMVVGFAILTLRRKGGRALSPRAPHGATEGA